ncbi:MAG: hypothetical protein IJM57_01355 [Lachnospiraceae bacterium]|nr:hypothetical protein [Lachnospiraceae bacterium]
MRKYPLVVLSLTLLLFLASLVCTFIGAFSGKEAFFRTGIAGLILVPMIGWIMVAVYNRVHREDHVWEEIVKKGKTDGSAAGEAKEEDAGQQE